MNKFFGTKEFYKRASNLAIPSMCQQLLNSAMGIVDTMMVSWIGAVSAAGIAAQLEGICITIAFGVMEGVGIFSAQFFGAEDYRSMKKTFGLALVCNGLIGVIWFLGITFFGREILHFYIQDPVVIEQSLVYLNIVRFSYPLTNIGFTFSYLFRCMHKTSVPMKLSIVSMVVNCTLNYLMIFGAFGFPKLGLAGAAWGTLIAQSVSVICYITYVLRNPVPFVGTLHEMFALEGDFVKPIMHRTYPMIFNETLFSFGISMYLKAYGMLGTTVTDAYYVSNTITNLFYAVCNGVSVASGMILGAELGKGNVTQAIRESRWFLTMGIVIAGVLSAVIVFGAPNLVRIFGMQSIEVFNLAETLVRVSAVNISCRLIVVVIFSTLRAGGDSRVLMLLDSGIMWMVGIPLVYLLILGFGLTNFVWIYLLKEIEQVVRIAIGLQRLLSNHWAVNLTNLTTS